MRRITLFFFIFAMAFSLSYAQDQSSEDIRTNQDIDYILKTRTINPQPLPYFPEMAELYTNGSPVNDVGGGPGGADGSVLQTALGLNTLGGGWQLTAGNSIADDFTVPAGDSWFIDSILVWGYQTGSPTDPSTFDGLYIKIYNGDPSAGGTVVWGDFTTNLLGFTTWSGAYRYSDNNVGTTRPIMYIHAYTPGLTLAPGDYWIEATATGTGASGPWMPPITITGTGNTGNAKQLVPTGWADWLDTGTNDPQGMPFTVWGTVGAPAGPGPASNPNPVSGATDVSANLSQVTWDNPAGATESILYWGTDPGAMTVVQSGGLNTSFSPPTPLTFLDTYYWRVDESDGTDTTGSPLWSFTVEEDPSIVDVFTEDFEGGLGGWTVTNNGGTCDWMLYPSPWPNAYNIGDGTVLGADSDECGSNTTMDTYVEMGTGVDLSEYQTVSLEFDTDFNQLDADDFGYVEVSVDGGTTWTTVLTHNGADYTAAPEVVDLTAIAALQSDVRVRFHSVQPGWDWWWVVDNIRIRATDMIPVELATFTAETVNNSVALNWTTATETNNSGFEVERKADGEFQSLGFVEGNGTTTELRSYNFVDDQVTSGTYTYRLKQIDFNGVFEYSDEVVVEVSAPKEFALAQNYPNPFNPSTVIDFSLPVDAKVTLKIFDVLGQEVMTLVNANYDAGTHQVKFNASNLNSGLYIYSIEAQGVNGQVYSSAKKMMLTK